MTLLTFGKHKNGMLEATPESYIRWLAAHKKVLGATHRYISDIAKEILEAREQAKVQVAALKELEEKHEDRENAVIAQQLVREIKGYNDYSLNTSKEFRLMQ